MNSKILSMMIISACMYTQVWPSNTLSLSSKEKVKNHNTLAKLEKIGLEELTTSSQKRIDSFGDALEDNEFDLALKILDYTPLERDILECRAIEKKIEFRKAQLSLTLAAGVKSSDKQLIQQRQEVLQIIAAFVQKQKESAKEVEASTMQVEVESENSVAEVVYKPRCDIQ